MEITKFKYSYYLNRIEKDDPFSFSRWGDGEWIALLQSSPKGRNCDGHPYSSEMGKALSKILASRPPYMLGFQKYSLRLMKKKILRWLAEKKLTDLFWHDADVFHRASANGHMPRIFKVLRSKPLIIVGPPHLRRLRDVIRYNTFIEIPPKNCYSKLKQIIQKTQAALEELPKPSVVCISASMPAEIIVHQLYQSHGTEASILDMGSVFDPYVGVKSRKYHRRVPA